MTVTREELFDLYKMVMEEYRFEVNLSWRAVQFYTILNSGIIGAGTTLLGLEQLSPKILIIPIFLIGMSFSFLGILTRLRYREYYFRVLYTKTLIEDQLKLWEALEGYKYPDHHLAISPTEKIDDVKDSINNPDDWMKKHKLKVGTAAFYQTLIFCLFAVLNAMGIAVTFIL